MKLRIVIFIFCVSTAFLSAQAQETDSAEVIAEPKVPLRLFSFADPHSPTKATIYAAVIPGLGHVYNRKYWKLPIVYGTFGAATWFMLDQRKTVREMNEDFRALYAQGKAPSPYDIDERDQARRFRDFAILTMSAVYVLQIVDATVDAHFYKLNVHEKLEASVNVAPSSMVQLTYRF